MLRTVCPEALAIDARRYVQLADLSLAKVKRAVREPLEPLAGGPVARQVKRRKGRGEGIGGRAPVVAAGPVVVEQDAMPAALPVLWR